MDQSTNHNLYMNASIVDSTTLLATPSNPMKVDARKLPVIGKIPVIISEADVQIYVDATIQLEEDALDITKTTKNVVLTRCQLLLTDDKKSSNVLLSGYVRKSIEYSIPKNRCNDSKVGDIHFTFVNIPFKCFAKIDFISEPVTSNNPQINTSSSAAANGWGGAPSSGNIINSEMLNERIFCELIQSKIRDMDVKKGIGCITNTSEKGSSENTFRTFSDSMVIELKLRVIQNQNIELNLLDGNIGDKGSGKEGGKSGNGCKQEGRKEEKSDNSSK